MRYYNCQNGFALISALVVLALVTSVSVTVAINQQHGIELTTTILRHDQLRHHADAVLFWANGVLEKDIEQNRTDNQNDIWNKPLQDASLDQGSVNANIVDLQGKFNLNNLVVNGTNGEAARQRFRRLLALLAIDVDMTDAIADWLDADTQVRLPDGAEDDYYLSLDKPYRTANQFFVSPTELLLVKGMSREIFVKLSPFVTTLPPGTPININTAPFEILMTLSDSMDETGVESLMAFRQSMPFTTVNGSSSQNNTVNSTGTGTSIPETGSTSNATASNRNSTEENRTQSAPRKTINRAEWNDVDANRAYNSWTWSSLRKNNNTANSSVSAAIKPEPVPDLQQVSETEASNASPPQSFNSLPLVRDYQIDTTGLSVSSNYFQVNTQIQQYGQKLDVTYIMSRESATRKTALSYRIYNGQTYD